MFLPAIALALLTIVRPACAQRKFEAPPKASPELRTKVNDLIDEVFESEVELKVPLRRSKIVRMKHDVIRVAVADPTVIEFVAFGPREVEVIGKETGSTTLTFWMGTPQQTRVLSMVVTVTRDRAVDDMRRLEYGELQVMLNEMFPDSKVQLIPIADKVIIRGEARDEGEVNKIMSIVTANSAANQNATGSLYGGPLRTANQGEASDPFPDALQIPGAQVISMLNVPGEKQVMLKVRIAEIERTGLRAIGTDFQFNAGDFFFSNILGGVGNAVFSGTFDKGDFDITLRLLQTNSYAKILAEPNLVTVSGKTATFLAGGEFAVPTVVGVGGAQAATTTFKGFGTQLAFTPTVLDKDRIRLQVSPSYSSLNGDSVGGIPSTDTRSVNTTVDLREGQVLAIAGLIQDQQSGTTTGLPGLRDIPGLGIPFSDKDVTRSESELIIVVSPELVHALEPENAPTILPGMEVTEPGDLDFFINGDIEGRSDVHHRSTVWYMHRRNMKRSLKHQKHYQTSEGYYIHGPHGFSD